MATKKTSTAVAKKETLDMANLSQQNVPGMLKMVSDQLKSLRGDAPDKVGTDSELPGFDKKIKSFDSVQELIMAHSSVKNRAKFYAISAAELDVSVTKYPFKLNGHTEEEWLGDISFQLARVKNKRDIERLEKVETTLSKYLSKEDQMQKDLASIASLLSDD